MCLYFFMNMYMYVYTYMYYIHVRIYIIYIYVCVSQEERMDSIDVSLSTDGMDGSTAVTQHNIAADTFIANTYIMHMYMYLYTYMYIQTSKYINTFIYIFRWYGW
jgi:hypothetical protein